MPIYVFECQTCENSIEVLCKKMDKDCSQTCSECGSKMKKVITPCSFHLKGSGWYVTDYKDKKKGKKTKGKKKDK